MADKNIFKVNTRRIYSTTVKSIIAYGIEEWRQKIRTEHTHLEPQQLIYGEGQ